jgi:tetratricopeptide (TPR) repeat protein
LLLLLAGVGGLWLAWQRAERHQAITADLDRAVELERGGLWAEARLASGRVEARLAAGDPSELHRRLAQVRAELDLVARVEETRLEQASVQGEHFDTAHGDSAYRELFRGYGLDVEAPDPTEAVERLRASPIRDLLLAALDDWVFAKRQAHLAGWRRLVGVARQVDSDPWRNQVRETLLQEDRTALAGLARDTKIPTLPPTSLLLLGWTLRDTGNHPLAIAVLRQAQQQHPSDFWINHNLGLYLMEAKPSQPAQAVGFYRVALALRPNSPGVLNNLGNALAQQGQLAEAAAALQQAIRLKGDFVMPRTNLARVLKEQGKLAESADECEKTIRLESSDWNAYFQLGVTRAEQGKLPEAVEAYEQALRLNPNDATTHYNLGNARYRQRKLPEAVAAFREAIRLQPDYAEAHVNLGIALKNQGNLPEAEEQYRTAIRAKPGLVEAHFCLALALGAQRKFSEAVDEYQEVIRLDPANDGAYANLGDLLGIMGKFTEARKATEKALKLLPPKDSHRPAMLLQLEQVAQMETLDQKLAAMQGDARAASADEALDLARLCQKSYKRLFAASARFYTEAFADEPKLADDPRRGFRYKAACAAALAGCGQGEDARALDDNARARLRREALTWLRAELAAWQELLEKQLGKTRPLLEQELQRWQEDASFAGVRRRALLKLPEAEQGDWQELWANVEAVRRRALPSEAQPPKNSNR